tara:strand:+ start:2225 stop:2332 length:108 start_codon:yes stop_codon:yes gene_type:complete
MAMSMMVDSMVSMMKNNLEPAQTNTINPLTHNDEY